MKYLLILCCLFFYMSHPVQAHVLETDDEIGGVLHIDPEDDPIAGETSTFFFELTGKSGPFDPQRCDCVFSIRQGESQLFATQYSGDTPMIYTFPERGTYQVRLDGKPLGQASFKPFAITYEISVTRVREVPTSAPPTRIQFPVMLGIGVLLAGGCTVGVIWTIFRAFRSRG